jgi:hypothetical protein
MPYSPPITVGIKDFKTYRLSIPASSSAVVQPNSAYWRVVQIFDDSAGAIRTDLYDGANYGVVRDNASGPPKMTRKILGDAYWTYATATDQGLPFYLCISPSYYLRLANTDTANARTAWVGIEVLL